MKNTKNIKIALLTPTFPPKGGGIASAHYNLYLLLKDQYNIDVFTYDEKEDTPDFILKITDFFIRVFLKKYSRKEQFSYTRGVFKYWFAVRKINNQLKKSKPNYIIVPDHYLPAYWLKKPSGTKLVWIAHHNYQRFRPTPILQFNNFADIDIASSMERKAVKKADLAICPSDYMKGVFKNTLNSSVPVSVVPNYVDLNKIQQIPTKVLYESMWVTQTTPIVYIPSAGSVIKGKRYVFEIVRRISSELDNDVCFFLSGNIPDDLVFELSTLKTNNILTPGHLTWEENIAYIKNCTITISPTLIENYSMALIEAQACGLPVITFDIGGNKEIIIENQTGYVVDYLDINAMINKAILLLKDKNLLEQYCINIQNRLAKILLNEYALREKYKQTFTELIKTN